MDTHRLSFLSRLGPKFAAIGAELFTVNFSEKWTKEFAALPYVWAVSYRRCGQEGVYQVMVYQPTLLHSELERQIQVRTSRRVRDLSVEMADERVILHGRTDTYHVK